MQAMELNVTEVIEFSLPSVRNSVTEAVRRCNLFLARCHEGERSGAVLVLRELFLNAVEFGNGNDYRRKVSCTFERLECGLYRMSVEDEGQGSSGVELNQMAHQKFPRRRSYQIIASLCERLEFNEAGNRVTAYLLLKEE